MPPPFCTGPFACVTASGQEFCLPAGTPQRAGHTCSGFYSVSGFERAGQRGERPSLAPRSRALRRDGSQPRTSTGTYRRGTGEAAQVGQVGHRWVRPGLRLRPGGTKRSGTLNASSPLRPPRSPRVIRGGGELQTRCLPRPRCAPGRSREGGRQPWITDCVSRDFAPRLC